MKKIIYILLLLLSEQTMVNAQCVLDQFQDSSNAGRSARNLPGFSEGQSFVPSVSGSLCEVSMNMFATGTGTGTLKIYSGSGVSGTLLDSQIVNVSSSAAGNNWQNWSLSTGIPVTAGQAYTFQFVPIQGSGLSDPYGVNVYAQSPPVDLYPLGADISEPLWDLAFRISIDVSTGTEQVEAENTAKIFPNPFHTQTTLQFDKPLNNASLHIYNLCGQMVESLPALNGPSIMIRRNHLPSGLYFIEVIQDQQIIERLRVEIQE